MKCILLKKCSGSLGPWRFNMGLEKMGLGKGLSEEQRHTEGVFWGSTKKNLNPQELQGFSVALQLRLRSQEHNNGTNRFLHSDHGKLLLIQVAIHKLWTKVWFGILVHYGKCFWCIRSSTGPKLPPRSMSLVRPNRERGCDSVKIVKVHSFTWLPLEPFRVCQKSLYPSANLLSISLPYTGANNQHMPIWTRDFLQD